MRSTARWSPIAGQLQALITDQAGNEIQVDIRRGDEIISTSLTPRENPPDRQGATGIRIVEGQLSILKVTEVEPGSGPPPRQAGRKATGSSRSTASRWKRKPRRATCWRRMSAGISRLSIERGGETIETTVTVPPAKVTLTQVAADSAASDALLYPGDVVVSVDGQPVVDGLSFLDMLEASEGTTVPVEVEREGRTLTVDLAVPDLGDAPNALAVIGANARDESPYEALGIDGIIGRVYQRCAGLAGGPGGLEPVLGDHLGHVWRPA